MNHLFALRVGLAYFVATMCPVRTISNTLVEALRRYSMNFVYRTQRLYLQRLHVRRALPRK